MSSFVEFPVELYNPHAFDAFEKSSTLSLGNALALMWFAQLSYETGQPDTIDAVRKLWGFDSITPFAKHIIFGTDPKTGRRYSLDTRGIVGTKGDMTIVALGGTDPFVWENVWTDAVFRIDPRTDTHTGFQLAYEAVKPKIDAGLANKPRHLFFAGHSLGGAMAAIAALQALQDGHEVTAVHTFGMPRTGGKRFATDYDSKLGEKTYRMVHGIDIVPRVPPPHVPLSELRFFHVGRMLYCTPGANFTLQTPLTALGLNEPVLMTGFIDGLTDFFRRALRGFLLSPRGPGPMGGMFRFLPPPIREHLQDRYLIALGDANLAAELEKK